MNRSIANKEMSVLESVMFLFMFVLPFPIICLSPPEESKTIQYIVIVGYVLLFCYRSEYFTKIIRGNSLFIILVYVIGAFLKYAAYGHLTYTSMVLPLVAFFGYYYVNDRHIKLKVFDVLMLALYVFFILTYFSKLPSLFMRVSFDDGDWYGGSSSNAISIILVNVLYIYEVLTYNQQENRRGRLFCFSLISLVLVVMQQSRAGILLSLLLVLWNLYWLAKNSKNQFLKCIPWIFSFISIYWLLNNQILVSQYVDVVGDLSLSSYQNDGRNMSLQAYFNNMTTKEFLVGYPLGSSMFDNNSYTFNTFVDHWNKYTILGFLFTLALIINRIIRFKRYYYPLVYLIPFFLYGWVEPRYLPNYWDFFIYLMLFKKCEFPKHTKVSSKSLQAM